MGFCRCIGFAYIPYRRGRPYGGICCGGLVFSSRLPQHLPIPNCRRERAISESYGDDRSNSEEQDQLEATWRRSHRLPKLRPYHDALLLQLLICWIVELLAYYCSRHGILKPQRAGTDGTSILWCISLLPTRGLALGQIRQKRLGRCLLRINGDCGISYFGCVPRRKSDWSSLCWRLAGMLWGLSGPCHQYYLAPKQPGRRLEARSWARALGNVWTNFVLCEQCPISRIRRVSSSNEMPAFEIEY